MEKRNEISISVRNLVINLRKEQKSYGEIAKTVNVSRSTVQTIIKNYNKKGNTENQPRSGRPKKLSRRDVSSILKEVSVDLKIIAPKLAEHIEKCFNKNVHPKTIQRALHENGFKSRVARKNPLISAKNRELRLEFAKTHIDKDTDFWKRVLFTNKVNTTFLEATAVPKFGENPTQP